MENSTLVKDVKIVKKDGTLEEFNLDKIINAVNKSSERVLNKLTQEDYVYDVEEKETLWDKIKHNLNFIIEVANRINKLNETSDWIKLLKSKLSLASEEALHEVIIRLFSFLDKSIAFLAICGIIILLFSSFRSCLLCCGSLLLFFPLYLQVLRLSLPSVALKRPILILPRRFAPLSCLPSRG